MSELLRQLSDGDYQRPVEELDRTDWDVAIAGAGPAGATAALHLAGHGHGVLLLDKARFPRSKVCGDGFSAAALAVLKRASLLTTVRELGHSVDATIAYSPSGAHFELPADYVTLERRWLDALLASRAVELGAAFHCAEATALEVCDDGSVRLRLDEGLKEVSARVLIIATGAALKLARQAGIRVRQRPMAAGTRCYVRSSAGIEAMIGVWQRPIVPGYAWIFPLGDELFNVGAIVFHAYRRGTPQEVLNSLPNFLSESPLGQELLARGERISPAKGAVLRGMLTNDLLGRGNVLAVGETAGTTLPLTGEGVGTAMRSGEIAAEVVHEGFRCGDFGQLRGYADRIMTELHPQHLAYRRAERWLARPAINDFMSRWVGRSEFLQRRLASLFQDGANPREVFSPGTLLRAIIRGE